MTRDTNYHVYIENERIDEILQVLKLETQNFKDKEEILLNLLCILSNLTYTTQFHDWFIQSELIEHVLNNILRNQQMPRNPKIRSILVN